MSSLEYTLLMFLSAVLGSGLTYGLFYKKYKSNNDVTPTTTGNPLALQAYERLLLLADRIALPNLLNRLPNDGLSASDMQMILVKNIRDEFDYNVTQQIYISAEAWNALKNFKEKNLLIINQIRQQIPNDATALDLQKSILTYLIQDPKANLHDLVSEALSYEAKKHI